MHEQSPFNDYDTPSCVSCPEWSKRVIELMGLQGERDHLKQLQNMRIDEIMLEYPDNSEAVRIDPEVQGLEQQIAALTVSINGLYKFIDEAPNSCSEPQPKLFGRGALKCTTKYRDC